MNSPVVVIGSGIAGLSFALQVSAFRDVVILTKSSIDEGSTKYAQGGIAAVLDEADNFESHIDDTMKAGSDHNDPEMVRFMVENGPTAINRLKDYGVNFDQELGLEGGHSRRRIIHCADSTGAKIEYSLIDEIKSKNNIKVIEDAFAVDLEIRGDKVIGCHYLLDGEFEFIASSSVIIATGGIGQLYKFTTNPSVCTGDGIAIAYRAGAEVEDMEFVQFHPTVFENGDLISEAVRGEGAKLINSNGERFVDELAPRDKVALAIYEELKNGQVYLDATHKDLSERFPSIHSKLLAQGIDMTKESIPVQPAAHYLCGGIKTDKFGRTNIAGLYAFGECAYTGVHGANRLASNSLLEAAVFASQIAEDLKGEIKGNSEIKGNNKIVCGNEFDFDTEALQDLMWSKVGVVRDAEDLKLALEYLDKEIGITPKSLEYRNMAEVGKLIVKAALNRPESLGCHVVDSCH